MIDFFNAILHPLRLFVAWVVVAFHKAFTLVGMPADSGWTWGLSIVGLVIVIRIMLIPLFVKQIKASRGLQLLQPEMKKIQDKYKGKSDPASRQAMAQEQMNLYKEHGTNPFSSCMPLLLQSPVFFALFSVLNGIGKHQAVGALTPELVKQFDSAELLGAPLSDTFMSADTVATQALTIVLIVLMSITTFTTQHQLMRKNMPSSALDNPFAQQQKILLYVMPVVFAVSGVNFPIGVLLYWLTTNVWTMGQQFYVIRRMPAPGSPAEQALQHRRSKGGRFHGSAGTRGGGQQDHGAKGLNGAGESSPAADQSRTIGQRQQPKRQTKSKRKGGPRPSGNASRDPGDGSEVAVS